jgi:hypothetical protein
MPHSLETLTVDAFQPRVGQTFRIRPRPESEIEAELIEARALGGGPAREDAGAARARVPFSLSFRTSLTAPLPQSIYEVAHDEMAAPSPPRLQPQEGRFTVPSAGRRYD